MYFGLDVVAFQMVHQFVPTRRPHHKKVVQIGGIPGDGDYHFSKFIDVLRRDRTSRPQPLV
jgi:hypothetical protein